MASQGSVIAAPPLPRLRDVKQYHRLKLGVSACSSLLSLALLLFLVVFGWTRVLAAWAHQVASSPLLALVFFGAAIGLVRGVLTLPAGFYSGFVLEHRFGLSNQTAGRWAWEHLKGTLVGAPLALAVLLMLWYCLVSWGEFWWVPLGAALTLLSVILARLAPQLILPLFYKLTRLPEGSLKDRLVRLCEREGRPVRGVFSFNLSKNTRKANAGFTGIGKSRRIILGDTLLREFTEDEVATVFAHELGHAHYHHIAAGIGTGIVSTFAGLFLTSLLYGWSLAALGFAGPADLAALPLLAAWLGLYGFVTMPAGNVLSRRHEYQADAYAVATTGAPEAFKAALRKLARMNLADPEPHPLVEFLFYSHPSIGKRIRHVEAGRP
jgi:STE24 endopeptidase